MYRAQVRLVARAGRSSAKLQAEEPLSTSESSKRLASAAGKHGFGGLASDGQKAFKNYK